MVEIEYSRFDPREGVSDPKSQKNKRHSNGRNFN